MAKRRFKFTAARRRAFRKMIAARRRNISGGTTRRRRRNPVSKRAHRRARRAGARMAAMLSKHEKRVRAGKKAARTRKRRLAERRRAAKKGTSRRKGRRSRKMSRSTRRRLRFIGRAKRRARSIRRRYRKGRAYKRLRRRTRRRTWVQRGRVLARVNRRRRRSRRNPSRRRRIRTWRSVGRGVMVRLNRRRGRRRSFLGGLIPNPRFGGALGMVKPALWALGGLGASRILPGIVGMIAPNALTSAVGVAGSWAGVALSGASLFGLHFLTNRVRILRARRTPIMVGATLGFLWEVASRVVPAEWLSKLGLGPSPFASSGAMSGWAPRFESTAIADYVSTPLNEYVTTPLNDYVLEGGMGAYVEAQMAGPYQASLGDSCPDCPKLPAWPMGTKFGDRTKDIVPRTPREQLGVGHCGIFGDSVFVQ